MIPKDVLNILDRIEAASKAVKRCQANSCKQQVKDGKVQEKSVKARMAGFHQVFQNDEDIGKYMASTKALQEELLVSDTTTALNACTLLKCKAKAKTMLRAMVATIQYDCNKEKNKQACDVLKEANAILKKKKLQPSDMIDIVRLLKRLPK